MSSISDTLTRLAREFVVRDIMVPEEDLVCSTDVTGAVELHVQFPDFDMIPLRSAQTLTGYVERGASTLRPIRVDDLVSDATSIIDVVDILTNRPRVFVLVKNRVGGYVHFSDLNRPIVKLPFFVLLEAVERLFFDSLADTLTAETVSTILDPERFADLSERMHRLTTKRADLNWAALLSFKELLLCAHRLGSLAAHVSEIDSLSKVRNLVCHAATADLLVEEHSHVRRLADIKNQCFKLLEGHRGVSA
jgi:hypothetical protein